MIRAVALEQKCVDPLFFTESRYVSDEKRKSWSTDKDLLNETAMLISIGTQRDKFEQSDTNILKNYVQNGGTLFLTPIPKKKPPKKLADIFGISFGEKAIRDKKNHGVFQDHIKVKDFQEHPANKEIKSIMFGDHGCYPIHFTKNSGTPIAMSSKDSNPPNSIVAAEIPYGEGSVIVVGQCRIFMDDYIGEENNSEWLYNLLEYGLSQDKQVQTVSPIAEPAIEENKVKVRLSQDKQVQTASLISESTVEEKKVMAKFCTNCGHKLGEGDKFCSNCGQRIL
jgi:DNA-directed RNA polymerase subunit L